MIYNYFHIIDIQKRHFRVTEEVSIENARTNEQYLADEDSLETLNLISNFLFTEAASFGDDGRKLCQMILETMLGYSLPYLKVEIQKVIPSGDPSKHGIRLDVYLEDSDLSRDGQPQESVYDIEMENKEFHPRRARYYHSLTDRKLLNAGADYNSLGNVIVLIIMPRDPFGKNRVKYTIKRKVIEDSSIEYDDGDTTYYFYTQGTVYDGPQEVVDLLHYIEDSKDENVKNPKIAEIHNIVQKVKKDKEVGVAYMKWKDYDRERLEEGIQKGIELERENTEKERQRAETEKQRAEAAENEILILKEELNKLQKVQ